MPAETSGLEHDPKELLDFASSMVEFMQKVKLSF